MELKPALYGFPDIASLLKALPHIVKLTGRPGRKFVELSPVLGSGGNGKVVCVVGGLVRWCLVGGGGLVRWCV